MASSISAAPVNSNCNHASYLRAGKLRRRCRGPWPCLPAYSSIDPFCITYHTKSRSIDRWQPPPPLIERANGLKSTIRL
ncbi:hypothetical protein PVAP13_5KG031433 [Panicum virgatum]|uniref:Uncharacterized protein n=1 Tax=Panicum virgatum TaxID=38727 RepID=A0A8T0SCP0_PANVG|nr:hypothetical protein PVAP13_5KG031433 [Panicum virgatum]